MWLTLFMWTLTKHYTLYPPYKFMQPGSRYYLFEVLIRCNCLDVLQTIKLLTLLYTAGGFLSFCLPSTTTVPQQLCTQSSSPAGSSLLAHLQYRGCSHVREMSPRPSHQPRITSAAQGACWHCPERNCSPPRTQQGWEPTPQQRMNFCRLCPSYSAPFSPRFYLLTCHLENIVS